MIKILVTGANGFIGKIITKKLLEDHSVDVYCRHLKKDEPSFITDNQIDLDILLLPYKDVAYDYVINCIACSDTSSKDWDNLYEANCKTTMTLINNLNFDNFIQFSSFSIYSESSITFGLPDPKNFYGLSKLISEKFLEIQSCQENKFIVLRLPIVIGGSKKQNDIINYLYRKLINDETIDLFNNGKYLRNIIHVDEVADYINEMILNSKFTQEYTSINLNSKDTISIYEICIHMKNKLNSDSKIQFVNKNNTNDFDSLVLNNFPELDGYDFKSCIEYIDYFIDEMSSSFITK